MKVVFYAILLLLAVLPFANAQDRTIVFDSGKEGYNTFRIPAIIGTTSGRLLAFAEGRLLGGGDYGDLDIVMKFSDDHGKSWSQLSVAVENGILQAGNPAPVLDITDPQFPDGRLFLFYNTGNNHENEIRKGKGLREVWYKTSVDEGKSWSEPVNITTQVHRPKKLADNKLYNFEEDWRSYANTPGHAMQFVKGQYAGRIFVAANHSAGEPQSHSMDYQAHGYYTDDHGKTFKLSDNNPFLGSNESTAAEISRGRLMINSRNQKGDIKARIVAISSTGGAKLDTVYFDHNLPDPVNEGSLLTVKYKKKANVMAFSNAASTTNRDNLTLRISDNDGKTWKRSLSIDSSSINKNDSNNEKDFTAYSDIIKLDKKHIGVLYERKHYQEIVFKSIKWK